ncbi:MAG: hypothetical protein AMXMBFR7_44740 [Planctomycetota bacterium]
MNGTLMRISLIIGVIACAAVIWSISRSRSVGPTSDGKAPPAPQDALVFDFEKDEPGGVPVGFTSALTGGGGPVRWQVQQAEGAPSGARVVAQLSDDTTNAR